MLKYFLLLVPVAVLLIIVVRYRRTHWSQSIRMNDKRHAEFTDRDRH